VADGVKDNIVIRVDWSRGLPKTSFAIVIGFSLAAMFCLLYVSQLTPKSVHTLDGPIHPKLSQIQALDIAFADIKASHPEVKDMYLWFGNFNFTIADYQKDKDKHPHGYAYSYLNDVRPHPELLHLVTLYLHPNGTRFFVNPATGDFVNIKNEASFLNGYCLQGKYCNNNLYREFAGRIVYAVDVDTRPNVSSALGLWMDADTGDLIWQSLPLPPASIFYNLTVSQLLNPAKNVTVQIASDTKQQGQYLPYYAETTIGINNKVIWTNTDSVAHTVTSDNSYSNPYSGKFDSGIIEAGQSYQYVFPDSGSYPYHCQIHPLMNGIVGVIEVASDFG